MICSKRTSRAATARRSMPSGFRCQAQFDAVCSFVYQLGVGVLSRASPFGSHLLARDWVAAGNAMLLYDQPAGVPVPELQHRRSLERALFLAPPMPASSSLAVLNRPERAAAARYESLLAQGVSDHEQLARMREGLALLRQLVWVAAVRGQGWNGSQVVRDGTSTSGGSATRCSRN